MQVTIKFILSVTTHGHYTSNVDTNIINDTKINTSNVDTNIINDTKIKFNYSNVFI